MRELDVHYLIIAFVVTLLTIPALMRIPIVDPLGELTRVLIFSAGINTCLILLSFLAIAPWGFSKHELYRCLVWIPTNRIAGVILTFLLLSPRVAYTGIRFLIG